MRNIVVTVGDSVSPIKSTFRAVYTAKEFKKRGFNVTIYAPTDRPEVYGVRVENIPAASQEKSLFKSSAQLMVRLFLKFVRNRRDIDMVFAHNIASAIPSLTFCKIFNKKFVYDMTDIQTEYFLENKKDFLWQNIVKMLMLLEYTVIRLSPRVIVVSEAMKEALTSKGIKPEKIFVIYDGAELSNFDTKKNDPGEIRIIHHGGVSPHDGVPLIPKAANIVLEKHPNVKFYIVGSGVDLENVKQEIRKQRLEKSFVLTGWQPYEKMKDYLSESEIGLVTRTNTRANNTILTLKLLEYWASGTAAIAPRLKAIAEVSSDSKDVLLFEPDNERSLADAIIKLIEDKALRKSLQANGVKTAQEFDWQAIAEKVAEVSLLQP